MKFSVYKNRNKKNKSMILLLMTTIINYIFNGSYCQVDLIIQASIKHSSIRFSA